MKTALLVGATGLVGGFVLENLLQEDYFSKVIVLSRKQIAKQHPKLTQIIANFDDMENNASQIVADVIFCCLGTTIKKAGSQAAFKKVDYEYPLKIAEVAKQNGASTYLIISAMGADKNSFIFYNRVKGEIEEAIAKLNFNTFHILQPSLIAGQRPEKRTGENIANKFFPIVNKLLIGSLSKYKSIQAPQIAKAMVHFAKSDTKGVMIHDSGELQKI